MFFRLLLAFLIVWLRLFHLRNQSSPTVVFIGEKKKDIVGNVGTGLFVRLRRRRRRSLGSFSLFLYRASLREFSSFAQHDLGRVL